MDSDSIQSVSIHPDGLRILITSVGRLQLAVVSFDGLQMISDIQIPDLIAVGNKNINLHFIVEKGLPCCSKPQLGLPYVTDFGG